MTLGRGFGVAARVLAWGLLALVLLGLGETILFALGPVAAFRMHLAVLAGLVFLLAIPFRAWRVAVPAGAALAVAGMTLGPVWRAPERPPAAPGRTLTILFANVYTRNPAPDAMHAALLAPDADVVVAAEAPRAMAGGPLARHYPHSVVEQRGLGETQIAIWSRYPVENGAVNKNPRTAPISARAVIRLGPDTRLGILGVHLARPKDGLIREQLDGLAELAAAVDAPLAIIGDLNAVPWSRVVGEAAARTGTLPATGYRVTWRGQYPVIGLPAVFGHHIDHLLTSPGIGITSLETVEIPGSDHLGLLAELVVPPEDEPEAGAALSPAPVADYVRARTR